MATDEKLCPEKGTRGVAARPCELLDELNVFLEYFELLTWRYWKKKPAIIIEELWARTIQFHFFHKLIFTIIWFVICGTLYWSWFELTINSEVCHLVLFNQCYIHGKKDLFWFFTWQIPLLITKLWWFKTSLNIIILKIAYLNNLKNWIYLVLSQNPSIMNWGT